MLAETNVVSAVAGGRIAEADGMAEDAAERVERARQGRVCGAGGIEPGAVHAAGYAVTGVFRGGGGHGGDQR